MLLSGADDVTSSASQGFHTQFPEVDTTPSFDPLPPPNSNHAKHALESCCFPENPFILSYIAEGDIFLSGNSNSLSSFCMRDQTPLKVFPWMERLRNFACVELRNQLGKLLVFVRVNPDTVDLEDGFTRDMRGIGHFGTGDLEISIGSMADFERAQPLFDAAYQNA